ncbi:hypothetical protein [Mycolicibacterium farcinogenes]|uniref:Uncharacterized protein n=1 Tax=Mycolicibacterium farcinogenes TaxID=1802 RepID=A0ACD1FKX1_MYCFR|nr:hypothetical protein [Mycolicibacterium farcinogenes]QZH67692.1 hypothetical protein K6L26_08695 [Mycolicibacterium farcinogenes]
MKLFISWSKETSHAVALALREWLPLVVPSAEPWVSSEDIAKGTRGRDAIVKELAGTGQGVICLTRQNVREPWLNFEAGALSNHTSEPRVRTVLFDLKSADVVGPLSDFQHTSLNEQEDVFKLVKSVNEASDQKLPERQLSIYFEKFWPDLVTTLEEVRESQSQLPLGADGAEPRSPSQVMEEVLERVRSMELRQRALPARIARLDNHVELIAQSLGLDLKMSAQFGGYVATPSGVGQITGSNRKTVTVELRDGTTVSLPRDLVERLKVRPNIIMAQRDYERIQSAIEKDSAADTISIDDRRGEPVANADDDGSEHENDE